MHAKKKLQDCLCLIKKGSTQLREFAIDLALLKRLVSKRQAATLLKMAKDENSTTFRLKLTKEELAKDMAITRPSLSREFASMVQAGIITQNKDEITILDPEQLKDYK